MRDEPMVLELARPRWAEAAVTSLAAAVKVGDPAVLERSEEDRARELLVAITERLERHDDRLADGHRADRQA